MASESEEHIADIAGTPQSWYYAWYHWSSQPSFLDVVIPHSEASLVLEHDEGHRLPQLQPRAGLVCSGTLKPRA